MSFPLGWETDTSTLPHLTLGSGGRSQRAGKYFGCSALLKGKVSSVVVCCVHVCVCVCVWSSVGNRRTPNYNGHMQVEWLRSHAFHMTRAICS